ncbi:DUF5391 family protein [Bacillus halotolerans]|uniref:DUF5391 family protein n=1 Tax=Bacillus halotolerans TaxID=260554 RepID=UPI000D040542|nr:DUF5391 family protein [Bacillus halotolerans]MCP9298178.1 DUF5391 domain-containing protein [Bacillus halotolerans]PRS07315.1 hypothetical protein C6W26_04730 [Bacillus halotolerans]PRS25228.1 hypothetical protein C6W25_00655 [Bacillus halotolerans]QKS06614.1 DUF5391 family protein [Bacillus halotolerans]WHY24444.1 DUF5391 family protein [Bacillus halotolerans]
MSRKNSVAIMTAISAFLFCAMIAAASLSPLAGTGGAANQFNSVGMWSAIGMIFVLYFIPLIIYMLGVDAMRYVMAVLCGFGLLIHLSSAGFILMYSFFSDHPFSDVIFVIGISLAAAAVNVIWFVAAFRSGAEKTSAHTLT